MKNTHFDNVSKSYNYEEFLQFSNQLVEDTTLYAKMYPANYFEFLKINLQRMKRINKQIEVNPELIQHIKSADFKEWWVITEPWCGDSAQNLPIIAAVAEAANIPLKIILRDQNETIMNEYLTNGGKSIPKLVGINNNQETVFVWGPRPAGAQALMTDWKENPNGRTFHDIEVTLHKWYADNKGSELQAELLSLFVEK